MKIEELSNYVCINPFEYVQVFQKGLEGCCWDWAKVRVNNPNIEEAWKELKWYREGALLSPLKTCTLSCPFLKKLKETGDLQTMFVAKKDAMDKYGVVDPKGPKRIRITCDDSCNLYCKSCRNHVEVTDYELVKSRILGIENSWGQNLEEIQVLGSGDPLFSKPIREFLVNFNSEKFPNLKNIYLHTNGQLLTEKLWKQMKSVPYIHTLEISIDASSKETYEKIRRGGRWETLLKNIDFISQQPSISYMCVSFVVQRDNYHEIVDFFNLFSPFLSREGRSWEVGYNQVMHWGKLSDEDFKKINIFNDSQAVLDIKNQLRSLDRNYVRTNII